jgi:hypothetical protein
MCFSAQASFVAAGALLPAGLYCVNKALQRDRSFIALAATPLFFSAQQFFEGMVWLAQEREDNALAETGSLGFLFFAIAFWPFWASFSLYFTERDRLRKQIIGLFVVLNLVWSVFYYPILAEPHRWLTIQIVHHSIHYDYLSLPIYRFISRDGVDFIYFAMLAAPLIVVSGNKNGRGFGVALAGLALVSRVIFHYAFISIWCFFAALLSLYLCMFLRTIPLASSQAMPQRNNQPAAAN